MSKKIDIVSVTIRCGEKEIAVPFDEVGIYASESECESCGSHGEVSLQILECPNCGKFHEVSVKDW